MNNAIVVMKKTEYDENRMIIRRTSVINLQTEDRNKVAPVCKNSASVVALIVT